MSLRYIVPTLGLVAFTTAPAMAADVGGLNVGGYVDTILTFADGGDAIAGEDAEIDFSAAAQLEIGYQIGDAVSANIELYWDGDSSETDLQQAYVAWAINEQVTITMGKFHNFIGWEGLDAPDLYRVNNSYMYAGGTIGGNNLPVSVWGDDVTGVSVTVAASEQIEFGVGIVDYIWNAEGPAGIDPAFTVGRASDAISFMAYATYVAEGLGYFDLDIGFGAEESVTDTGEAGDIFQIDINGEIDTLKEDNGLLFAFDINYTDYDAAGSLGILLLANYVLPTEVPMSATLSLNYLDAVDDDDIAEDDEGTEIAVALLTNPTDDENFSLNVEARSITRGLDDSDEFGVYLEMLAIIP